MESTKQLQEAIERWVSLDTLTRFVQDEYKRTCVSIYGDEGEAHYQEQFEELFASILAMTGIHEENARDEYEALYEEEQGEFDEE